MPKSPASAPARFRGTVTIDVSGLVAARSLIRSRFGGDPDPFMAVYARAAILALRRQQAVASSRDREEDITLVAGVVRGTSIEYVNITRGQDLGMQELVRLLSQGEEQGSEQNSGPEIPMLAIVSLGDLGIDDFEASGLPPCQAALTLGSVAEAPVVRESRLATAHLLRATLTVDKPKLSILSAARFLSDFKEALEHPVLLVGE
jgi:pyruvate/2-oxoglutarate dehydrogenase complex dihydrolipoamide acyltransferase (E2) component